MAEWIIASDLKSDVSRHMGSNPIIVFMLYFEPLYGLFVHTAVSTALCLVIFLAVYFVNTATPSHEKNEGYECGFKAVDVTYTAFDVQFYRIGVLFLLFDVEILFFFP